MVSTTLIVRIALLVAQHYHRDIMVSDNMKFNGDFEATVDDS